MKESLERNIPITHPIEQPQPIITPDLSESSVVETEQLVKPTKTLHKKSEVKSPIKRGKPQYYGGK